MLHADGTVTVAVRHARQADTVDVTLTSQDTTFRSAVGVEGCRIIASRHILCRADASAEAQRSFRAHRYVRVSGASQAPAVGDLSVRLPLAFPDSMVSDDIDVTASVRGVEGASASTGPRRFRPARTPSFDFVAPVLGSPTHTLAGDEDRYDVPTTAVLPPRVIGLVYTLSAPAHFRAGAGGGCTVGAGGRTLRCAKVTNGDPVILPVAANGLTTSDQVSIRVSPAGRFVDPSPGNNTAALTLRPGVDLGLNVSVAARVPLTGLGVLTGTLTGQRAGLSSVAYSASPGTTFAPVTALANPGCTVDGARMTCPALNRDVTLVLTTDTSDVTPVTVSVSPSAPFEAVGAGSHSADVVIPEFIPGQPVFDFSVLPVTEVAGTHTLAENVDTYQLTSPVPTLPAGLDAWEFELAGGDRFAAEQSPRCTTEGSAQGGRRLRCTALEAGGNITFRVESTSPRAHDAVVSLLHPGYLDPDTTNNSAVVSLTPGVDLHLGPLTPADPLPVGGDYQVSTVLTGVRSGPVSFEVSGGATVTATSCARDSATRVTCASPTNGQIVGFTLRPTSPAARTAVTITASASAGLLELDDTDDFVTTSLAPDVAISSLTQRSSTLLYTVVRAQITGVPTGVTTLRLHLSGDDVGLTRLRFTSGAEGADGEGDVNCFTSSATGGALTNGVDVTCTDVQKATGGSFYVDTRLARLPLITTDATFTVMAVGADEGTHTGNNRRVISLRW